MKTVIIVFVVAAAVVALMMSGLGLKMLLQEFRRPCTNADPLTGKCQHCTCGKNGRKVESSGIATD